MTSFLSRSSHQRQPPTPTPTRPLDNGTATTMKQPAQSLLLCRPLISLIRNESGDDQSELSLPQDVNVKSLVNHNYTDTTISKEYWY
eukprot:scaffold118886_cov39-Cyclotella_meneghiniana.AAC.1